MQGPCVNAWRTCRPPDANVPTRHVTRSSRCSRFRGGLKHPKALQRGGLSGRHTRCRTRRCSKQRRSRFPIRSPQGNWKNRHDLRNCCSRDSRYNRHRPYQRSGGEWFPAGNGDGSNVAERGYRKVAIGAVVTDDPIGPVILFQSLGAVVTVVSRTPYARIMRAGRWRRAGRLLCSHADPLARDGMPPHDLSAESCPYRSPMWRERERGCWLA